ncbi:hypothetical protein TSAR_004865 [Trichomalopsis sarcophagae]|uniref:DUF6570 domain-containing protein n=1 Tax=Trichomalopsis sarcophagae TaxID=543379 RepID=A0A232EGD4_9HYME|nr:hypothetical protein TSAR_004865 [Trichomalopsis sarcophagae]
MYVQFNKIKDVIRKKILRLDELYRYRENYISQINNNLKNGINVNEKNLISKFLDDRKTAANDNLRFPSVPDYIQNLSSIEERMVSPYIPFMQIRALQPYALNSQLSLKGSIINIPTEINEIIKVLPRNFNQMSIIQIKLKRHIDHQTDYMYETIKPSKICEALEYLVKTPLYQKHNIKVDDEFFFNFERNNQTDKPNNDHNCKLDYVINESSSSQNKNNDDHNNNQCDNLDDDFEINDKVLILDRNEEITSTNAIITLA